MTEQKFNTDWFSLNHQAFSEIKLPERPVIIEVGCWEGQSTCWMIENWKPRKLYAIDTFRGSEEHQQEPYKELVDGLFMKFMKNVKESLKKAFPDTWHGFDREVVIPMAVPSLFGLSRLIADPVSPTPDFVYIDGSHKPVDVITDAIMGFSLLKPGGIMVFDDYAWGYQTMFYQDIPRYAIDIFLDMLHDQLEILRRDHIVVVRKNQN